MRLLAREFVQFAVRRAVLRGRVGEQRHAARARRRAIHQRRRGSPRGRRVQPNTPAPQKTHRIAAARNA